MMDEYDDLSCYDGDPAHDGWVDFDYNMNTAKLDYIFDEHDNDNVIANLND